ncbi:MAG: hypothetical protein J6R02_00055 [Alistipes sp.]|nr:hypothetical protein [Alistipes sp.]
MVVDVEIENFIGMWTRTWEADGDVQVGTAKYIYVWRFYDDYSGYLTINDYDKNGKYAGLTRSPFTYKVEQNKLFIYYAGDKEAIEWDYYFEGDTLHVARETDEYGEIEHVFYRGVDADDTQMGEWVYTTTVNGKRVDKRFCLYTPTDASKNEVRYNEAGNRIEDVTHPREYKYTFDDSKLYLKDIETEATTEYTYHMSGNNLYLKAANSNTEVKYSKKEN